MASISFQHAFIFLNKFHFKYFLISGTRRSSRLIFYFPCPSSGINHFSKEPGSFYRRMAFRTFRWYLEPRLGPRCTHCSWDVTASRPCQLRELGNICTNAKIYVYTPPIFILVPFYMYMYFKKPMNSYWYFSFQSRVQFSLFWYYFYSYKVEQLWQNPEDIKSFFPLQ